MGAGNVTQVLLTPEPPLLPRAGTFLSFRSPQFVRKEKLIHYGKGAVETMYP